MPRNITPDEGFITKNYVATIDLVKKTFGADGAPLEKLIQFFGERYAICPATHMKSYYSSFPGGLAYHNLHTKFWVNKFSEIMAPDEFSKQSLLLVSFLHEIGKLGTKEQEYFLPPKSDWHTGQGYNYEINPRLQFVKVSQRSLFLAQEFGIPLSQDEYLAILLHEGQSDETNSVYKFKEPKLAIILQYAVQWARKLEQENVVTAP